MSHLACLTSLLLLLQVPPAPAQQSPNIQEEKPRYDVGPLKAEVTAMREIRLLYLDNEERGHNESNFAMQVRIRGERIKEVSRHGMVILTELVDDTGHAMVDDQTYSERDKTELRPMSVPAKRLQQMGLTVVTRARPSARGAKQIKTLKGTVRLILAGEAEKFTIVNPGQYVGKTIDDPRLKELGLEIYIAPGSELQKSPPGAFLALVVKTKQEHLKGVTFFDGNMQAVRYRQNPVTTQAGDMGTAYILDPAALNNELQLVLEVHRKVEDIQLPIEAENIDLP